ncbi:MAG: DUF1320 domain-containing protein [Dechloromonas sp.]|nr:MAG: DUF1320 domain-containing protein [Dechloromonas sp.]
MTYATQADLEAVFGIEDLIELTDQNRPQVAIDAGRVAVALRDASGKINAYLAARYQIPLTPVPEAINRTCVEIAWYYLHASSMGGEVQRRYDRAIKFLEAVASGTATLTDVGAPASGGGGEVLIDAAPAVFDADSLAGF